MTAFNRRELLLAGMVGTAAGAAALVMPAPASAAAPAQTQKRADMEGIRELQAAFHEAKTNQNLDLMTSLWTDDAVLVNQGDAKSPYTGPAQIRAFFQKSGSFTHKRLSLVPSFKMKIDVNGDQGYLYFECHDVGDYDQSTRSIAADLFLAGTVRNAGGKWRFWKMTAGNSSPLSADHYYFP